MNNITVVAIINNTNHYLNYDFIILSLYFKLIPRNGFNDIRLHLFYKTNHLIPKEFLQYFMWKFVIITMTYLINATRNYLKETLILRKSQFLI